jgi:acetoin utilization deacetylase AcuC-like enzyme
MKIIFDEAATKYGDSQHPERPERLLNTVPHLRKVLPQLVWDRPLIADDKALLLAHDAAHLARLRQPMDFDVDTPYYPEIDRHARRAAGGALLAVESARQGEPAFSLLRPPGHHAKRAQAMGFCYLNSIAVAALAALGDGCERVAIWDFDAHHGNGTEAIVAGNGGILFASIHQFPGYPGTGTHSFQNILNLPVPPMTDAELHAAKVKEALDRLVAFRPDLLLVSAGFDAYLNDPITNLRLETDHFYRFGTWLRETNIPAAAVLEGGYSDELPQLIAAFIRGWTADGRRFTQIETGS